MADQSLDSPTSETDRFLADTVRSLVQLEELDLEELEPATVFVVPGDGG